MKISLRLDHCGRDVCSIYIGTYMYYKEIYCITPLIIKATVTPSSRTATDYPGSDPWLDPSRVRSAAVIVLGGLGWSWTVRESLRGRFWNFKLFKKSGTIRDDPGRCQDPGRSVVGSGRCLRRPWRHRSDTGIIRNDNGIILDNPWLSGRANRSRTRSVTRPGWYIALLGLSGGGP